MNTTTCPACGRTRGLVWALSFRGAVRRGALAASAPRLARGPANSHANPLIRARAASPRHGIAGLCAISRVSARNSGFARELRARPDAVVSTTHIAVPTTPRCRRLSPRSSAMWAPHHPEPRPHRQQTGGIAPLEPRHAGDTPTQCSYWCKTPKRALCQASRSAVARLPYPVDSGDLA